MRPADHREEIVITQLCTLYDINTPEIIFVPFNDNPSGEGSRIIGALVTPPHEPPICDDKTFTFTRACSTQHPRRIFSSTLHWKTIQYYKSVYTRTI